MVKPARRGETGNSPAGREDGPMRQEPESQPAWALDLLDSSVLAGKDPFPSRQRAGRRLPARTGAQPTGQDVARQPRRCPTRLTVEGCRASLCASCVRNSHWRWRSDDGLAGSATRPTWTGSAGAYKRDHYGRASQRIVGQPSVEPSRFSGSRFNCSPCRSYSDSSSGSRKDKTHTARSASSSDRHCLPPR